MQTRVVVDLRHLTTQQQLTSATQIALDEDRIGLFDVAGILGRLLMFDENQTLLPRLGHLNVKHLVLARNRRFAVAAAFSQWRQRGNLLLHQEAQHQAAQSIGRLCCQTLNHREWISALQFVASHTRTTQKR